MSMFLSCYVSSEKPPFVVDLRRIHINQSINHELHEQGGLRELGPWAELVETITRHELYKP